MIARQRLALIVIWCLLFTRSSLGDTQQAPNANNELKHITTSVQNGTVNRIQIFWLPKAMATRTNLTPERLQKIASKTVVGDLDHDRQSIVEALKNTRAVAFTRTSDLRRGVIFYSRNSAPLSIYYDQFNQGLVDRVRAKFSGAFLDWVENHIPSASR